MATPSTERNAMDFGRSTCRRLHEEHEAVFELLRRLQRALVNSPTDTAPDFLDPAWSGLWRDVRSGLEFEVARHFDFEERSLFPILAEAGDGDLVELLNADHKVIRDVAAPLLELVGKGQTRKLDASGWRSLKRLGLELCDRLTDHAQKEEQTLLPVLESLLSEDEDRELFAAYAGGEAIADRP
jgi:hemerythrin-like domain-containing protein